MRHLAEETALEIELNSLTFHLVSSGESLQGARLLFGGSFNPPHIGHEALLGNMVEGFPDATLTLIPVYNHAFGKHLVPFDLRLRWCKLLAQSMSSQIEVSDIESRLDGSSLSTVKYFAELEPDRRLVWVIGSDLLPTLASWRGAAQLSQLVEFCVFQRRGASVDENLITRLVSLPEISSTELRGELADGRIPQGKLPKALVQDFLKDNPYLDQE